MCIHESKLLARWFLIGVVLKTETTVFFFYICQLIFIVMLFLELIFFLTLNNISVLHWSLPVR